ncbi:hypothetical protein MCOR27_008448 [Pyricularia oryzae]|uniref:Laccase n=1 Tax=Pyricularia grisea TaxID=148305 RepID=A0ABQ8N2C7_PYRGI|nr:hypothetical protein MCOR01_000431 [Pyricularia oryzae]KAI6289979.1 hypothetical protein MCOR33_011606 [Pyricularia grisea]KAI6253052.1 hypothetical protein MCOR19_010372 [Pyricularia oryzae]KAI6271848.1 hypothetical protein MCOR26_007627 [Pyricularia oryzae]KAI6272211.1 hypothetical protein MCOR27_008448 [Pyricularia oryzae]
MARHALALALASTCSLATALSTPQVLPRAAGPCAGNTATTRSQWCDFSIDTDYHNIVPDTGVTREYWLELAEIQAAPDGRQRSGMAINGSIPGPTLFADWGDNVIVHVTNNLPASSNNGTSMHFHGIRQNYTNQNDGVTAITQCPTAPGSTVTYKWRATQYGSTWYHSHWALQAWHGMLGGLVINGPATQNYDEDLGMLFLNDWDLQTVDQLYHEAQTSGPPTLDQGLINGTNVFTSSDGTTTGHRWNTTLTAGKSYRIRLVNGAIDTHWKFSLDNHTLTVIGMDLVPIKPYTTNIVNIGMGQRYDLIVTADQASTADAFWMRAIPQSACSENDNANNIRGIVYYGQASDKVPTTTGYHYEDSCDDEDPANLVPHLAKDVGASTWADTETASVAFNEENLFRWYLNTTTMVVDWKDPTVKQVASGNTSVFEKSNAVMVLDKPDEWIYLAIQNTLPVPHPIHLHGHDFQVLAQGIGEYQTGTTALNLVNPPRRDTALLPASGYVVLAFQTDNPGAWLMHCHIGWHTSEGFAMQFVERQSEMLALIDQEQLESSCAAWASYQTANKVAQEDSGI